MNKYKGIGMINFMDEFDGAFANKFAIRCTNMHMNFRSRVKHEETSYAHIYILSVFLWKLKIWKP